MKRITFLSIAGLVLLFLLGLYFCFGNINLINSQNSAKFLNSIPSFQNSNPNSNPNSTLASLSNSSNNSQNLVLQNNKISLSLDKLEIAKTPQEEQKGLMFRSNMCENCGMIFEFENEDYRSFWMKNTLIDLDIIFIEKGGKIINIANAKAEKTPKSYLSYPTYPSTGKAKYVLEVNSGFAQKMKLESGKYLEIDKLLAQSVPFDNSYGEK